MKDLSVGEVEAEFRPATGAGNGNGQLSLINKRNTILESRGSVIITLRSFCLPLEARKREIYL